MGKLYIVGFGPGNPENLTEAARAGLQEADIIVGYTGYTRLLRPLYPDKAFHETGMTQEVERCRAAIDFAKANQTVCVISSGDSGVYGMASLIFELAENKQDPKALQCENHPSGRPASIQITVIPGITAAISGAALLGAPLSHDFAIISLSDLLTKWEVIEKRLRTAADGDFVICLYNPGSKKRAGHLSAACTSLLEKLPTDRLCGIARNIGRDGQSVSLMTLGELCEVQADMNETVFIGNSQTRMIDGRMITPRGYQND